MPDFSVCLSVQLPGLNGLRKKNPSDRLLHKKRIWIGHCRRFRTLLRIDGAYQQKRAGESVSGLAHLANRLSGMNIYAAVGNSGDQPFEAIELLQTQGLWSNRVLLQNEAFPVSTATTGPVYKQWNGTINKDIAVNTKNFHQWWGSSGATNIVSTYADMLLFNGVPQEEINNKIYESATYTVDVDGNIINVIEGFDSLQYYHFNTFRF